MDTRTDGRAGEWPDGHLCAIENIIPGLVDKVQYSLSTSRGRHGTAAVTTSSLRRWMHGSIVLTRGERRIRLKSIEEARKRSVLEKKNGFRKEGVRDWEAFVPDGKWREALPGIQTKKTNTQTYTHTNTTKAGTGRRMRSYGMEMVEGAPRQVIYVVKPGCIPHVYTLRQPDVVKVASTTNLAEMDSDVTSEDEDNVNSKKRRALDVVAEQTNI